MSDILSQLHDVLESRKGADPDSSYVASLYAKGLNKILEKVGEEAVETLLAARDAEVVRLVQMSAIGGSSEETIAVQSECQQNRVYI